MSRWTQVDSGLTDTGATWRVGLVKGRLTICVDRLTVRPEDADRFAEAVARAVTPAQAAKAPPVSGMNSVERAARDLIGIPDGL